MAQRYSYKPLINGIYHRSSMQTDKSQPEGKRIMPETRLTSSRHYPLTRGLGFLGPYRRPMIDATYVTFSVSCELSQPMGWLVGCLGFNDPLRQYFSLYRAVSQREGERGEKG